jgi:hypothetical protein
MSDDATPAKVRLTDVLGPGFVPAAWQERQKLSSDQWTHWYECQPFPRSAPRDFMIGMIPAQRRVLQSDDQIAAALDAAVFAERERWRDAIEALAHSWDDPAEAYGIRLALKECLRA